MAQSAGAAMNGAAAGARQTVSLDGAWQFSHEGGPWREAQVPGPWQAQFPDLVDSSGKAVYKRSFDLPQGWANREVALHFGAVSYYSEVRVNGQVVGTNEGGYLPFECLLPKSLRTQGNEIEVHVTLPTGDTSLYPDFPFAETPHGKQSWYGPLGGIWQSVRLEGRDARHIKHIAITASMDGKLAVRIESAAAGAQARLSVHDASGQVVAQASLGLSGEDTAHLDVANPKLWSIEEPALYRLDIAVLADGQAIDSRSEAFGFRTVETRDGKILLNGKPVYMRAALDQDYYPQGICTPPSLEFLEDQARKAKHLGLNTLRCHIKVPDPRYHDVADRFGLLVWTEIPNVQIMTDKSAQRLRDTMAGIVRRDGNHPSIVCWTIINEDWGTRSVENADHRQWLKDTYDWLKALDPTRMVVDNSACFPNFHVKTDLNDYHYYRSVPERRQEWDDITAQFAAGADWTYSTLGDAERVGNEPLIVSEFGVWGLPNPAPLRHSDGSEPFWFETGASWGDGVALPHGIERRFQALGLAKTFGDFDSFIEAVQWYQFNNLKYEIEVMRSHASIMGYVITELTDVHWEANGLMDIERNPRVFHDVFGQINADIVIVPKPERYAAVSGQQLDVALAIATGGAEIGANAELVWTGEISGKLAVAPTSYVSTIDLGRQVFAMPTTDTNRVVRVEFELREAGRVIARNSIDLNLYARRQTQGLPTLAAPDSKLAAFLSGLGYAVADSDAAEITVVHALDAADIDAMQQHGRKYLVLADGSLKTHRNLRVDIPEGEVPYRAMIADERNLPVGIDQQVPGMGLVDRDSNIWRGDWIAGFSWIRREGAFADLPGGPLLDLSYDQVVPHHVLTGFRSWEYGSSVKAGLVVGWCHKPGALIAERQVGRGGIVATTFRLTNEAPGSDPVAAALLDGLVATLRQLPVDGPEA